MLTLPMSDAQFAAASNRLRSSGIVLDGSTGTLTKDGITAKYAHANGQLSVEIIDKPFLLPLSLIEGKLQSYFEQSNLASPERSA